MSVIGFDSSESGLRKKLGSVPISPRGPLDNAINSIARGNSLGTVFLQFHKAKVMIELKSYGFTLHDEATIKGAATIDDAREFAQICSSHRLVLNAFRGWDGDLVGAAKSFEHVPVRRLSIFSGPHTDISSLECFRAIEELQVAGLVTGTLNLDWFSDIAWFGLGAELKGKSKIALNWGKCRKLRDIGGLGSKLPPIEVLATFPLLESLSVVKPDWNPNELQLIKGLVSLDISYWRKLESIGQLGKLMRVLKKFELYQASKLSDYSAISDMQSLRRLSLEKCPSFPSVRLLQPLQLLEELFLIDMKVVDGDMLPLMKIPKLRNVALADYKHYSPSRAVIYSKINARRSMESDSIDI